jgi:hypothetical protein
MTQLAERAETITSNGQWACSKSCPILWGELSNGVLNVVCGDHREARWSDRFYLRCLVRMAGNHRSDWHCKSASVGQRAGSKLEAEAVTAIAPRIGSQGKSGVGVGCSCLAETIPLWPDWPGGSAGLLVRYTLFSLVTTQMPLTKRPPTRIPHQCSIASFRDGVLYELPVCEWQRTDYSRFAMVDGICIKLASPHGYREYEKYVIRQTPDKDAIRGNEALELYLNLHELTERYAEFHSAAVEYDRRQVHWLLIHRLQHERLKQIAPSLIPNARFVFFYRRRFLFNSIRAGLVQSLVVGTTLWDMIDHAAIQEGRREEIIKPEFRRFLPLISRQLNPLVNVGVSDHVNWHIKNFIFNAGSQALYYVDMKPSNIFGRWRNDQNLANIKRDFLQQ